MGRRSRKSSLSLSGLGLYSVLGLCLFPLALLLQELAFRHARLIDRVYGGNVYPHVAFVLGGLNSFFPFCLAELLALLAPFGLVIWLFWRRRQPRGRRRRHGGRPLMAAAARLWIFAGIIALGFLLAWGLNYARPSVRERLGLSIDAIEDREVLQTALRAARRAAALHRALDLPAERPTHLSMDLARLDEIIDGRLRALALPGDPIHFRTSPVKRLLFSQVVSYLGITGVFIPFTGEPTINGVVPDVVVPFAVAHEKAHQRGITHEGEANFVAFLACAGAEGQDYVRYSAYFFAARRLIGAASIRSPEKARALWEVLGPGPRRDVEAVRAFWSRHRGPAAEIARQINDTYLRSQHVDEGIRSYGEVVGFLVALYREGRL